MNLWYDFITNHNGRIINKWEHYFPIYEKHLSQWRNKSVTFIEIGVSQGGSLQMWRRFFGPLATIVGIDINPTCARYEEPGINIRIGDQSNPDFLQSLVNEFGLPDIILDDGSHQQHHIVKTFEFFYPKLSKNGLYIVEDLHTSYMSEFGGGLNNQNSFTEISKELIDRLHADYTNGLIDRDFFSQNTFGINFYDSVIVFERGTLLNKKAPVIGKPDFTYKFRKLVPPILQPFAKKIKRFIFT
jgi:cephalosporin hydroxylase